MNRPRPYVPNNDRRRHAPLDGVEDGAVEVRVVKHGRVAALLARVPVLPEAVVQGLARALLHPGPFHWLVVWVMGLMSWY